MRDTSSFSIVFAPSGRLVVRTVRVRNKDGIYQPDNGVAGRVSTDGLFNSPTNINGFGAGMLIQDDYAELGLGAEPSRNKFIIYDKNLFEKLNALGRFDYLHGLTFIYINSYTGTMILPD
ncbi:MAG: hypothetical protein A2Z25_05220 [Planctomycetes bacterium RBG_16_55_9]|nr:MAG: hypothetical protein A2Z25_05220 [Planctomycetes bacterium RBG_16_55_9]